MDALMQQSIGAARIREVVTTEAAELHPVSKMDPKVKEFKKLMASWVNSHVIQERLAVRDLAADLSDGLILAVFLEKLTKEPISGVNTGATADKSKKKNIQQVLQYVEERLKIPCQSRWTVDGVFNKDFASVAAILVELAHMFGCPYELPSHMEVSVMRREPIPGKDKGVSTKTTKHQITGDESLYTGREGRFSRSGDEIEDDTPEIGGEKDTFDILFEAPPEKLNQVVQLLLTFVNKHLSATGVNITRLPVQFHDGVYLIILIGTLGNFFIPIYNFHLTPTTNAMKLANVKFAFQLMESLGIQPARWSANSFVRQDLKAIMRVLYSLFSAFKSVA